MRARVFAVVGIVSVVGLAVAQRRSDPTVRERIGWAPRFDAGVTTAVVLYALAGVATTPQHDYIGIAMYFAPFLLVAAVLCRQYYVLAAPPDRAQRDIGNVALIALPTAGGLVGALISADAFLLVSTSALLVAAVCLGLFVYDMWQLFRNRRFRVQDFTTTVLGLVLGVMQLFILLLAAVPTASDSGIAN